MKKLIIAEDILAVFDRPEALFRRGTIEVHPARTAEEMLDLHREIKADLIVADAAQPVMGGAKLCSSIRGDAGLKDVSIIIACDGAEKAAAPCREWGANAVVPKPVDAVGLFDMMAELITVPMRKGMRVLLRITALGGGGAAPFFASSENISTSGMLIESASRLGAGDRVACSFYIGKREMRAEGSVARVASCQDGRFRYGIKFANLDAEKLIAIEQFIEARSRLSQKLS